jgi:predicted Zn-dependent protease
LRETLATDVAPWFGDHGAARLDEVVLIADGAIGDPLVSPRSANQLGVAPNGADDDERPVGLDLGPADLAEADALRELGTGLFVGDLSSLSFTDRSRGRFRGTTRFGTFWVEGGHLVAPVAPLHLDGALSHLFGDGLVRLFGESRLFLAPDTYLVRPLASVRTPGALVRDVRVAPAG